MVVLVPYVDAVFVVTVMRVLLFVLDVSMLRECEGDDNDGVGDGEGVFAVSAGHEYVGSTRGSGIVSSAADVLEFSVVCGMIGVGGVCELCMCLAQGSIEDWDFHISIFTYFTNVQTGKFIFCVPP